MLLLPAEISNDSDSVNGHIPSTVGEEWLTYYILT